MGSEIVQQQCLLSRDERFDLPTARHAFPFTCKLSLAPLINFWQLAVPSDHAMQGTLAMRLQNALQQAPDLLEPIADLAVVARHQELVDTLMTLVFPRASWDEMYAAALIPFHLQSFYATPSFKRLLMTADGHLRGRVNVDEQTVEHVRLLHAYTFILSNVYGIDIDFDYPLILTATDPEHGLERHFRMNFDGRFTQVKTVAEVKPLTDASKQQLLANLGDPQVLMEILPPEQFILHGFFVLNAVEVTDQEVLSSLKRDLIDRESIISNARFQGLQDKVRTLFRKSELLFGLAACQRNHLLVLRAEAQIKYG
jgi:hypothetical protein